MEFNNFANLPVGSRRKPNTTSTWPRYSSYEDVRGEAARPLALAMGIAENSAIANTAHLIELRHASDHTRISAHGKNIFKEVLIFQDTSIITLDFDAELEEAIQTVYSPNGDIERLMAKWSPTRNGYFSEYKGFSLETNKLTECRAQWEKYEKLVFRAEEDLTRTGPTPKLP